MLTHSYKQGHDFVVVGRSPALDNAGLNQLPQVVRHFDAEVDTPKLNFTNPARRDATMLPGLGWLIVAFRNDNPGAWLFHCHIAVSHNLFTPSFPCRFANITTKQQWHASMGLSVQFLEKKDEIKSAMNLDFITDNCKAWQSYIDTNPLWQPKNDSGI